jgi:hypothetical protein
MWPELGGREVWAAGSEFELLVVSLESQNKVLLVTGGAPLPGPLGLGRVGERLGVVRTKLAFALVLFKISSSKT